MTNSWGKMLKYAGPGRGRMSCCQGVLGRLAVRDFHCGQHLRSHEVTVWLAFKACPTTDRCSCCHGACSGFGTTEALFTLETNSLGYVELIIQKQQLKGLAD